MDRTAENSHLTSQVQVLIKKVRGTEVPLNLNRTTPTLNHPTTVLIVGYVLYETVFLEVQNGLDDLVIGDYGRTELVHNLILRGSIENPTIVADEVDDVCPHDDTSLLQKSLVLNEQEYTHTPIITYRGLCVYIICTGTLSQLILVYRPFDHDV